MIDKKPSISILMCTFNGDLYIRKQLLSIERQLFTNWKLYISDDGSNDNTIKILKEFQKKWSKEKMLISYGPKKGHAKNFLTLAVIKK